MTEQVHPRQHPCSGRERGCCLGYRIALEARRRAPAINGAPRGRSSTLLPCRGAVPGKVTPRGSPGRHLGDDGLEPEDPELGYFATSPQAGVFASSQFGEKRRVAPAGGARSDRHGGASSDSHAQRRALRSIPGVRALLRASGEKCSVARSNVHDQCGAETVAVSERRREVRKCSKIK